MDGCLVPLRSQDRALWDTTQIRAGVELTLDSLCSEQRNTYTLRAAIAALHAEAPSHATTPWKQVAELYDTLVELEPSVSNETGRAVAHLEASGAEIARPLLQAIIPPDVASRFVINLAWARLHELDHERTMAVQSLDQALLDSPTEADRNAIERLRAAQLAHTHGADGRSNGRQRRSSAERDPT